MFKKQSIPECITYNAGTENIQIALNYKLIM